MRKNKTIFTIASGRCGTQYLSVLFSAVNKAISLHEPSSESSYLREIQKTNNISLARKFVKNEKIKSIKSKVKNNTDLTYIETSHLLCKGFLDCILEEYPDSRLIYLERDIKEVAISLYKHRSITQEMINDNSIKPKSSYRFPNDKICEFRLPQSEIDKLSDFELCLWYWHEIRFIYEKFAKKYDIIKINLKDLNDYDNVVELFKKLDIQDFDEEKLKSLIGEPRNVGQRDNSYLDLTDEQMNKSINKINKLLKKYEQKS